MTWSNEADPETKNKKKRRKERRTAEASQKGVTTYGRAHKSEVRQRGRRQHEMKGQTRAGTAPDQNVEAMLEAVANTSPCRAMERARKHKARGLLERLQRPKEAEREWFKNMHVCMYAKEN